MTMREVWKAKYGKISQEITKSVMANIKDGISGIDVAGFAHNVTKATLLKHLNVKKNMPQVVEKTPGGSDVRDNIELKLANHICQMDSILNGYTNNHLRWFVHQIAEITHRERQAPKIYADILKKVKKARSQFYWHCVIVTILMSHQFVQVGYHKTPISETS